MARYPGAKWRPLPEQWTQARITPTQVILHSAVDADGPTPTLWHFFDSTGIVVESHFWITWDGTVEQYIDTVVRADANYTANIRAISVETESDRDADTNPWSDAQLDALTDLGAWAAKTHGIPVRLCPSPDAPGFGWHTMWGAPGAWTPAPGKTCPGTARILQVPGLLARIASPPDTRSWFDMATEDELRDVVRAVLREEFDNLSDAAWARRFGRDPKRLKASQALDYVEKRSQAAVTHLAAIEAALVALVPAGRPITKQDVIDAITEAVVRVEVTVRANEP